MLLLMQSPPMSTAVHPEIEFPKNWHRRHLLDLESLSREEISTILDVAQQLKELTRGKPIDEESLRAFISQLEIPEEAKQALLDMTPLSYAGTAEAQARSV